DAQDHAGAASVGRIVDLPGAQRRRLPVVEEAQLVSLGDRVLHRPLPLEPVEGLREQGEDVELQSRMSTMTRRSMRTAAAWAAVRLASATRPPLPITRPRSPSATVIS